jgi:hypothetical protein
MAGPGSRTGYHSSRPRPPTDPGDSTSLPRTSVALPVRRNPSQTCGALHQVPDDRCQHALANLKGGLEQLLELAFLLGVRFSADLIAQGSDELVVWVARPHASRPETGLEQTDLDQLKAGLTVGCGVEAIDPTVVEETTQAELDV